MVSKKNPKTDCGPEAASPTAEELISQLRSSFFATEFQNIVKILVEREEKMNEKCIEFGKKAKSIEREKDLLFSENLKLSDELKKQQKELDVLRKVNLEYKDQIRVLNLEKCKASKNLALEIELKKKQSEIDAVRKVNVDHEKMISELKSENCRMEAKIRVYEKQFSELDTRVLSLERTSKVLMDSEGTFRIKVENEEQNNASAAGGETSRAPLFGEDGGSNRRTEPIQIDNDDDRHQEHNSTFKRTRVSNEIKIECDSDADGDDNMPTGTQKRMKNLQESHNRCTQSSKAPFNDIILIDDDDDDIDQERISTIKRKRVSNEIKKEYTHDDDMPTVTQKSKNLDSSPGSVKKIELQNLGSTIYSSDSSSDSDHEDIIKPIVAAMKMRKERWGSKADLLKELHKDDELCVNAICALYRQRARWTLTCFGINIILAHDLSRIAQLAQLLIDGDPEQKLKKKAEELNRLDLDECRKFAKKYSPHIFCMYKKKNDPFFPPSTT